MLENFLVCNWLAESQYQPPPPTSPPPTPHPPLPCSGLGLQITPEPGPFAPSAPLSLAGGPR